MRHIMYKKGYKYQLHEEYAFRFDRGSFLKECKAMFITYDYERCELVAMPGYAWDGPSGPTLDTKTTMRGSLVHDIIYQLIRLEILPFGFWRNADRILDEILREDGMCRFRRWYWIKCLQLRRGNAAKPRNRKKIHRAP